VFHQGKKTEYNFSGPDACCNFYFTAFYADCQHEVKPITKGYQLCLIYNLLYGDIEGCPTPADNQKQVSAIVSAMTTWNEDATSKSCPKMITYMLEHKYCEASLSFDLLKNGDQAVADVLVQAKAEGKFDLYIGNVHLTEIWSADHDFHGNYSAEELCDEELTLRHVRSYDGEEMLYKIDIRRDSFVPENFFGTIDPDEEEFEEATGNEGATVDKQYNWAALLLWPVKQRTAVVGLHIMVGIFEQDVKNNKKEADLIVVAKDILREMHKRSNGTLSLEFLRSLLLLDNKELIIECLDTIVKATSCYSGFIEDGWFCSTIGSKYGWSLLKSPLKAMFEKCASDTVEKYLQFLLKFLSDQLDDEQKDLCQCLAAVYVDFLVSEPDATPVSQPSSSLYGYGYYSLSREVNRNKEFVCQVVKVLKRYSCDNLLIAFVNALCNKPIQYPVVKTLVPAMLDMSKITVIDGPLQILHSHCVSKLEAPITEGLTPPSNYVRPVNFSCPCNDCASLKRFLQHPNKKLLQFSMNKKRLQHLEQQIHGAVDVTHTTEQRGKTQSLVIVKTQESYDQKVKEHKRHQTMLALLRSLGSEQPECEPPTKKQKPERDLSTFCSSSLPKDASLPVVDRMFT